ncbi:hypothetical protein [Bifidobacterium pseudolongum]|jgi:hypothetical protein|uniref:Uncharacterized protein n=1 Tax=Bifidobacterium pseudolongum subsp. globosum TaxID=1690 RepID=A0A4Q5BA36_9BIFI|nr:hypothetical protein [Bifidobacterium pseudolongum]RYQ07751.1 hypothetical protein PG2105B_0848 [Bifidobacterium pseudolongum subsp. globosum]RYQ24707.1 hypothetical protein PG2048B_1009 [Bifidobacterium pseudolongum subsp. globosum]RYQ68240.1 hypothetical protein PG2072B_0843 [Bifidobacterium pseudolongum subsp. globosum]
MEADIALYDVLKGFDGETSECTGFIHIAVHHQHRIRRQPLENPV